MLSRRQLATYRIHGAIDTEGLDVSDKEMEELLKVDIQQWLDNVDKIKEHYQQFGDKLPEGLKQQLANLEKRLKDAK